MDKVELKFSFVIKLFRSNFESKKDKGLIILFACHIKLPLALHFCPFLSLSSPSLYQNKCIIFPSLNFPFSPNSRIILCISSRLNSYFPPSNLKASPSFLFSTTEYFKTRSGCLYILIIFGIWLKNVLAVANKYKKLIITFNLRAGF